MSSVQLESLWQYIQSLYLSPRNRQWLAERLIEGEKKTSQEVVNAQTLEAMQEAQEGKVTTFTSFDQFKQHLYEL